MVLWVVLPGIAAWGILASPDMARETPLSRAVYEIGDTLFTCLSFSVFYGIVRGIRAGWRKLRGIPALPADAQPAITSNLAARTASPVVLERRPCRCGCMETGHVDHGLHAAGSRPPAVNRPLAERPSASG